MYKNKYTSAGLSLSLLTFGKYNNSISGVLLAKEKQLVENWIEKFCGKKYL